jgi:large subunit ribosomal protein L15
VRAGFEGGQQPLYRRLPKFVGRPMGPGHTKKEFHLITLEALNAAEEGATVSFETLYERGELNCNYSL